MRLAFRQLTVDQLHVLLLTLTEVVTTYLAFRERVRFYYLELQEISNHTSAAF